TPRFRSARDRETEDAASPPPPAMGAGLPANMSGFGRRFRGQVRPHRRAPLDATARQGRNARHRHNHHPRAGNSPAGFKVSTAAISTYIAIPASAGPRSAATEGGSTARKAGGRKARPAVSTNPTSSAATKAPRTEP